MSDVRHETENGLGTSPRGLGFCGTGMDDAITGCPCGSIVRAHPRITLAILALAGLAGLVVVAGAVLGILACLRTF